MPEAKIYLNSGRVLTGSIEPREFPPATVKRYISIDELTERLIKYQDDWLKALAETGGNPQAVTVDLLLIIDDVAEMMGIERYPQEEQLDIQILSI